MKTPDIPRLIELPRIYDPRGNLTFVQNDDDFMPFKIERAYWIYDVPAGAERGSNAHIEDLSLIIAAGGSFNVNLFDGVKWWKFTLNRQFEALFVPPGYWRTLDNFSSGSVCLSLTSLPYSEDDYIRDFDAFMRTKAV